MISVDKGPGRSDSCIYRHVTYNTLGRVIGVDVPHISHDTMQPSFYYSLFPQTYSFRHTCLCAFSNACTTVSSAYFSSHFTGLSTCFFTGLSRSSAYSANITFSTRFVLPSTCICMTSIHIITCIEL